jgi:glycogen debranching enzyme
VQPDPEPDKKAGAQLHYSLDLEPEQTAEIQFCLRVTEASQRSAPRPQIMTQRTAADHPAKGCTVQSSNKVLNDVMQRSLLDIKMLASSLDGCEYISAGLPWYGALFGRDSIGVALQTLAYDSRIAGQTIELLAKYQGTRNDDWRDEQPGKILHELRRGELAHLDEIPQTPYYGSVDSTPLFLILIGQHAQWSGDLTLFTRLQSNIERALQWIDTHGHRENPRYLAYSSRSKKGLSNQGWKDSGDSIMNADGSLAEPPIALVEVQGYVYMARLLMADLYERNGDHDRARGLRQQAGELKEHFNRDFWVDAMDYYAIALEKHGRPASVISSNPGQALWTGIVDEQKAPAVVRHLLADDMFTGWGIRTLSEQERRFNPIGYHLGTVWPHDNSIIMAGMRRYGLDREAGLVMNGILSAGEQFEHYRLREVFAGFSRRQFSVPVHYPVACHPQAWAAGAVPFMLTNILGITADGFNNRLRILRPVLPQGIDELQFNHIKVGDAAVSLRFSRVKNQEVAVDVAENTGNVEVDVQTSLPQAA